MKLKRFETMNEAKSKETKELEEKALNYIKGELEKVKMSRADMVKKVKTKFKDEDGVDKVANKTADDIMHDPLKKKLSVKSDSYDDGTYKVPYFYLGDAKEPTKSGLKKVEKKEKNKKEKKVTEKEETKKRVDRFEDFDEKEAQKAKDVAEKDIKDDKKGDKSDRQVDFSKDSTKQLIAKLRNDKYKEHWDEMEEILDKRGSKE